MAEDTVPWHEGERERKRLAAEATKGMPYDRLASHWEVKPGAGALWFTLIHRYTSGEEHKISLELSPMDALNMAVILQRFSRRADELKEEAGCP